MEDKVMRCPICSQVMVRDSKDSYICEHGVLISGAFLSNAKSSYSKFDIKKEQDKYVETPKNHHIVCPNCESDMEALDYVGSGIIIDTCKKCHFRWLDSGELEHVRAIGPKYTGQQMLFLSSLENEVTKANAFKNTKIPYFNFARSLTAASYMFGRRNTAGIKSITALGLFGIVNLLLTRLGRLLLLIIIIFFGLLAWQAISFISR